MTGAVFQPELIELNLRDHQQNDDFHYVPSAEVSLRYIHFVQVVNHRSGSAHHMLTAVRHPALQPFEEHEAKSTYIIIPAP